MANAELRNVFKAFGQTDVIKGVDLEIQSGEFIVFVGPSGCGKSTLLRLIAGLEEITSGDILIDDKVVTDRSPSERGIAMVFQSYALYPHMNVFNNMSFGMRLARETKAVIAERVHEAADILQLTPYLDRLPKQLSGGQRQRVAIGRAIVRNPRVFLFDEPLSNLDAALRVATRIQIAKLADAMPDTTMIYVTHDQVEALTLADRIVVLNGGLIEQIGTPMELYHRPANLFVARFIGSPSMNTVPCRFERSGQMVDVTPVHGRTIRLEVDATPGEIGMEGSLGARPEHLKLVNQEKAVFSGKVDITEALGEVTLVYVDIGADEPILAKVNGDVRLSRGDVVHLAAEPDQLHLFAADGQAIDMRPIPEDLLEKQSGGGAPQ